MSSDSFNFDIVISQRGAEKVYSDLKDIEKLVNSLIKKPIVIKLKTQGAEKVYSDLRDIQNSLKMINKKTFTYNIRGTHTVGGGGMGGGRGAGGRGGRGGGRGAGGGAGNPGNRNNSNRVSWNGQMGIGGLIAHAVPVQLYNFVNTMRLSAAIMARSAGGVGGMGTAAGAVAGVGGLALGGVIAASIAAFHAHRIAVTTATQVLTTAFSMVAQGVMKFGEHLFSTIEETRRAETTFASLAVMGTGKSLGQLRTEDPSTYNAAMMFSRNASSSFRDLSVQTGQDFARVAGAAKALIPDIMDKLSQKYKTSNNVLRDHGEEVMSITQGFIRLGAVMRMADPMGKNLAQQIFPLQEILAGTSGKGVAELFTSLRRRTGIKIAGKDAAEIAAAVNSNDLQKAFDLLEKRMARAGISITMLSDLFENTLAPNIDGIKSLLTAVFTPMGDIIYNALLSMTKRMRGALVNFNTLSSEDRANPNLFQNKMHQMADNILRELVSQFTGTTRVGQIGNMDQFLGGFFNKGVMSNPLSSQSQMFKSIETTAIAAIPALKGLVNVIWQFMTGILGLDTKEGASDFFGTLAKALNDAAPTAKALGESMRGTFEQALRLLPVMLSAAVAIEKLNGAFLSLINWVVSLSDFTSKFTPGGMIGKWMYDAAGVTGNESFRPQDNPYSSPLSPVYRGNEALSAAQINKLMEDVRRGVQPRSYQNLAPTNANALGWNNPALGLGRPSFVSRPMAAAPTAQQKNDIKVTSSPNIKNEINVRVTPQMDQLKAAVYESSLRGAEEGVNRANKQNQFAFSGAMSEMMAKLNRSSANAAPPPPK